jgi:regulatory protein
MKQQTPKSLSPMEYAMKYLTIKDRTVFEMQRYLDGKEFGEADVDATVARLIALGLLNDARYAQRFVETRLASKPVSRRHLYEQMKTHGLSDEDIQAALGSVEADDELENARTVAEKFARQFASLEPEKRRERVLSRLIARGYSYDVSRRALEDALSEEETWSES